MGILQGFNKLIGNTPEAKAARERARLAAITEKERQAQLAQQEIEYRQKMLQKFDEEGAPEEVITAMDTVLRNLAVNHVILDNGEKVIYVIPVDFYEERLKRRSSGSGVTFRVMKGVYYHTGGGQSYSTPVMTQIDKGVLIVTTDRIVFSGSMRSFETPLSKVTNVAHGDKVIQLSTAGKQKTALFRLSATMIQHMNFDVNDQKINFQERDEPILIDALITGAVRKSKSCKINIKITESTD